MTVIKSEIRTGAYYDSAFLMQLQRSLATLPGVQDAGVIMGTEANKELLAHIDLVSPEVEQARPDDLVIIVRAEDEGAALNALGSVDDLLTKKKTSSSQDYRPQSIESAVKLLPDASWVLISVAGRYATGVARKALRNGKHVFLFSDNVSVEDEIALKQISTQKGLLVMGPDCGTAMIGGMGLGFANKIRKGPIGVVAAAGTGLQHVTSRIHQLGSGITFGIGTGGRDLSEKVGAMTFKQGIDVLSRDPDTRVIVLVSKPPAPRVAEEVLQMARQAGKPVVVNFIGRTPAAQQEDNLFFAKGLDDAARLAVNLGQGKTIQASTDDGAALPDLKRFTAQQKYLRGLYSGGTLAYEGQFLLTNYLPRVWANAPLNKENKLANALVSQEHTIVDLGEDEFTVGRLHPMMDNELRIRRILEEAEDPTVAVILLDVVIGYGSHPDPASELAPAIAQAKQIAEKAGRYLEVVAVVTGTDEDPQNLNKQISQLEAAGAWVSTSNEAVVHYAGRLLNALAGSGTPASRPAVTQPIPTKTTAAEPTKTTPVDLETVKKPLSAINVGLESFAETLVAQGVPTVHVDWRPSAGGNEKMMNLLERLQDHQETIEKANQQTVERMMEARPVLLGVGRAIDVIPGMRDDLLLHAGPPITWERMAGPLKGAVVGALIFEGKAKNWDEAEKLITTGKIKFAPCHHHSAVGPMAGVISPSMLVYIVENKTHGNRAYSGLNEGRGKVLRMGAYSEEVITKLRWMNDVLGPTVGAALEAAGGVDLRSLLGKALHMGDDGHNRLDAASMLFTNALAPYISRTAKDPATASEIIKFLGDNALSILNPVMAACKTMTEAAEGIEGSTVVTVMARNGTDFGIRVSGLPGQWFCGPAQQVKALYFPGYTEKDANPDIGDSTITETSGIGGFAMASAPAIVTFIGGVAKDAVNTTMDMYEITYAEHKYYTIPYLDFRGTPTGIDIRKVVDKNLLPRVNTGVAHKDPGVGQVGAGVVTPPANIFEDALIAFAEKYGY